jgi:hypothetical protein
MTSYLFADFQREDKFDEYGELIEVAPFVYEAVPDIESIRKRIYSKTWSFSTMHLDIFSELPVF